MADEGKVDKPTLLYFGLPGRGFAVRVTLFHSLGKDGWVDERIEFGEWGAMKKAYLDGEKGRLTAAPYLPQLTLPGGQTFGNAVPMSKWAAVQGEDKSLYPEDSVARLKIDEAIEIVYGATESPSIAGKSEEEAKAIRTAFKDGPLLMLMGMWNKRLEASGGPFLLGAQMTIADLWAYFTVNMIVTGAFDHVPKDTLDHLPAVKANFAAVIASDYVQAYKKAYDGEFKWDQ